MLQSLLPVSYVWGQGEPPAAPPEVESLIAGMTPQERVGQLFLVTFPGSTIEAESVVATLVRDLHVGGVVLRATHGNYANSGNTPDDLADLSNALQALGLDASRQDAESPFVPLFIALDLYPPSASYADGLPTNGFTRIPSEMALGATWSKQNAESTGRIVGQELSAVGVNLLLGPLLDVEDTQGVEQQNNLGTSTFGSNPYWVGQMGKAFVRGVAIGSEGQVATIASHFPGVGSSDRRPDQEIATVQKPLSTLQQQDLPPFYAVTSSSTVSNTLTVDGLMTTNVRYRGLQGNIRQTTRPISLDAQSLPMLLSEPKLQPWRAAGGILVSEELGAPALRRFYQEQTGSFPARTVARDAFNAGNDLLFLGDFALDDDWSARLQNIEQTIQFFTEQYNSDPVFAGRVDESLRRLLALKLRLYGGDFQAASAPLPLPSTVEPAPLQSPDNLSTVARIAQEAATLLYPSSEELSGVLPAPPRGDEDITIFTDIRLIRDCATCPTRPLLDPLEFENQLLQRYGPAGSGELVPERISSLSFDELDAFLTAESPASAEVARTQSVVEEAEWLIFLVQDKDASYPEGDALSEFLRVYNPQLRGQRLVVFTFGSPYYLDATEVSKVTAYYALYTATPRFVEAAASLLFQALPATGAAPVSLYPLNYSVEVRLEPNPNQTVNLCKDAPEIPLDSCMPPDPLLDLSEAENREIDLRTGIILDHKGNPVPDGTRISFLLRYPNEGVSLTPQNVETVDGVAHTTINLARDGQLSIVAVPTDSAPFNSAEVIISVQGAEPVVVVTEVPTPTSTPSPSVTPQPSPTTSPLPTLRATRTLRPPATPTATPLPVTRFGQPNEGFGWWVFMGTIIGLLGVGSLGFATTGSSGRALLVRRLLLVGLFGVGAYLAYLLLYALRLLPSDFNGWGAIAFAVLSGFVALVHERE